jgi:hypothetical protein
MRIKSLEGQAARWFQHLQEYTFTSYRQGQKHSNADDLSQRICQEECTYCQKVKAWTEIKQCESLRL